MDYFGLQIRLTGGRGEGRRRKEKKRKKGRDQAKVWMLDFGMEL